MEKQDVRELRNDYIACRSYNGFFLFFFLSLPFVGIQCEGVRQLHRLMSSPMVSDKLVLKMVFFLSGIQQRFINSCPEKMAGKKINGLLFCYNRLQFTSFELTWTVVPLNIQTYKSSESVRVLGFVRRSSHSFSYCTPFISKNTFLLKGAI